jgi:tetratricopeptide (TPR) repeat protein
MISIALFIALVLCVIITSVLWIMVLISMFKNEGALKGILGFLFGIYAFIWGWIKHKQFALTKVMVLWSALTVAAVALVPAILFTGTMELMSYAAKFTGESDFKFLKQDSKKSFQKASLPGKRDAKNKAVKSDQNKSTQQLQEQDVDWSQKALALRQGGKYTNPNEAINYWNRAISSNQNTAVAYSNRGLAYHDLKQYQKAVKDYSQAIKLDPDYAAAYNNRGNSYYELNEYQLALNDFNQSLKLKPQYAMAYLNRGLVFYQMDKNTQACRDFQESCDQGDCDGIKWAMKNRICN